MRWNGKAQFQFVYGDDEWLVWESVFPINGKFERWTILRAVFWKGQA